MGTYLCYSKIVYKKGGISPAFHSCIKFQLQLKCHSTIQIQAEPVAYGPG